MGEFEDVPVENLVYDKVEVDSGVCKVRYAPISSLSGTPKLTPITAGATIKEIGTFAGDVTFETGKGWNLIKTLTDTSEPKNEGVGPKGQRRLKSMFEFHIDGDNASVLGTQRFLEGVPCVYLVETRGGDQILVGDICNPAYATTSNFTAGKTKDDTVGCTFNVEASRTMGVYTGVITEI